MRKRPMRSNLFKVVIRLGVASTDWKFIFAAALTGYLVPLVFDIRLWRLPLFLWTGLATLIASYAFFFWARIGRRPRWFEHTLRAALESPVARRTIPADHRLPRQSWLLE